MYWSLVIDLILFIYWSLFIKVYLLIAWSADWLSISKALFMVKINNIWIHFKNLNSYCINVTMKSFNFIYDPRCNLVEKSTILMKFRYIVLDILIIALHTAQKHTKLSLTKMCTDWIYQYAAQQQQQKKIQLKWESNLWVRKKWCPPLT